jgi:hypothetical protein
VVSNKTDKKISKLSNNYKVYNYTITNENIHYRFIVYDKELNKQSHEEHKYLDLMKNII